MRNEPRRTEGFGHRGDRICRHRGFQTAGSQDPAQAGIRSPESLHRILSGIDTMIHLGARAAFEPYLRLYPSIVRSSLNLMHVAIDARLQSSVFV